MDEADLREDEKDAAHAAKQARIQDMKDFVRDGDGSDWMNVVLDTIADPYMELARLMMRIDEAGKMADKYGGGQWFSDSREFVDEILTTWATQQVEARE